MVTTVGGGDLSSSSLGDGVGGSGVPLAMGNTPVGVADFDDPSLVVGSTRTVAQWCGGG
jgi:hypothetical protein